MPFQVSKYRLVWFFILIGQLVNSCQKSNVKPDVLVLAHAGMSLFEERSLFPANTFEAIQYAVDVLGSEGVEIDVQLTKDSVLVLFHDNFITVSPGFEGCIGNYNWEVIKSMPHKNSEYRITRLDTVMNFLVDRNVNVYLDMKPFNFCKGENSPLDIIANRVDSIMKDYSDVQRKLVIAGALNRELLQLLNTDNKSIETKSVDDAIKIAEEDGFGYILVPVEILDQQDAIKLINSPFNWGVFGGKSNGQIRKTIALKPDYFISDNFVFTQKITK